MPGILPMKVIKVGPSAQARIAQACDRCRSKKIRCDGIRPCCSQCSSVGFECKTSDKLSRRAFPRGYTESLEERVRALELEVRELKDLLDEKDEKIDMLSRMHSNRRPSMPISPSHASDSAKEETCSPPRDDIFRVQASPLLINGDTTDSYYMGASSGRAFIDAFKKKIQESGKSLEGFNTEKLLTPPRDIDTMSRETTPPGLTAPPRMFSDRCVNIFFQEWAPLFPVLHRPTFLHLYEEYVSNPEDVTDAHKLAQLHLVFSIAGISSNIPEQQAIAGCDHQWRSSLESIIMENTIPTLQCLVLALIHCILTSDYIRLQHYKGITTSLALRLGLHQSQKRFSFGALTTETRKRVFWTFYTIDCFSAALLGLPKSLNEDDIHAEYPSDTDDEYVTEQGFSPTLPGEYTRISSALALFRASRILSKVLEQNYPSATAHDLSLSALTALDEELREWSDELPTHLKLTFAQDKPSTDVTGNRSALLSLAYYYVRSLIHRPAVGSTLGRKASPSVIALADSSKHMIQIVQLLEERSMSFSFCINKNEMLVLCGLSLLYQGLDLKQEGKLMQDSQRLVLAVVHLLEKAEAPGAPEFRQLASQVLKLEAQKPKAVQSNMAAPLSTKPIAVPAPKQSKHPIYRMQTCSISESELLDQQEKLRRATMPSLAQNRRPTYISRNSMDNLRAETPLSKREHRASVPAISHIRPRPQQLIDNAPNLDYLSLSNNGSNTAVPIIRSPNQTRQKPALGVHSQGSLLPTPAYAAPKTNMVTTAEWESLLGSLDGGQTNLYDAIYGGPPLDLPDNTPTTVYSGDWSPEGWDMRSLTKNNEFMNHGPGPTQSVLSCSDDSLSSGEEFGTADLGLGLALNDYRLSVGNGSGYFLDGFDETFGLGHGMWD